MASHSIEKTTNLQFDAVRSRSSEDEERIERFLHMINRSEMNIMRSIMIIEGISAPASCRS